MGEMDCYGFGFEGPQVGRWTRTPLNRPIARVIIIGQAREGVGRRLRFFEYPQTSHSHGYRIVQMFPYWRIVRQVNVSSQRQRHECKSFAWLAMSVYIRGDILRTLRVVKMESKSLNRLNLLLFTFGGVEHNSLPLSISLLPILPIIHIACPKSESQTSTTSRSAPPNPSFFQSGNPQHSRHATPHHRSCLRSLFCSISLHFHPLHPLGRRKLERHKNISYSMPTLVQHESFPTMHSTPARRQRMGLPFFKRWLRI
ncbi:hypothetical protein P152DRAFT_87488 [Eremomyces bilateralis CBS 781.70]|uniref:Uncharacterized protein n=1 Tax=Eremomyces bilateralis CBS 781.70 TaxID=1392243 RepID=A0A6G1FYP4_9PEZI|nr:uncharacterized protein P152DRAFT_87488 [Eremomyces bilateralis CBS 781.70]KAF1810903.1 hypothetical protein P152DRAFT_87488 [Eremomyces bilateralis CBS 781.70]